MMTSKIVPHVTLVGAGPGDPELLTLKALSALQAADIVVYDRLVSDDIMALIPRGTPKIYAGKSCRHKAMAQEEINQLLVTLAKKYTRVVRLKGGDPFLFGRGGEEMLALRAANIAYEIIPGITSAQGCAASAGIPLTHRGLATGVRFITGHRQYTCHPGESRDPVLKKGEKPDTGQNINTGRYDEELEMNWPSLADADTTLVVYMGLANVEEVTAKLIEHGLSEDTPAAIIERGTTKQQRVISTVLSALAATISAQNIQPPSLLVIGKVAALRAEKQEFSHLMAEIQAL